MLGFPGNPNSTANLAFLDQRLAVEWVRDNIEKFGGDPSRITIFGQSAGGASVDFYSYAWNDDPIVAGLIAESGNVIGWGLPNAADKSAAAWYNLTSTVGCGNSSSDAGAILTCMRSKDYNQILSAIPSGNATASILGFFGPTVDEKVVFSNYSTRTPADIPMLIGNNNYEGGLFRTTFALTGTFFSDNFWNAFNLQSFTCPTGIRANLSLTANVPTWRYRYFGIFPNLAVSEEAGTWHAAEVPMLFNTAPGAATPEQVSIGNYMRGAWATFAKDPTNGLTNYGWPRYNTSQDTLIRLAYDNITGPNLINPLRYDADCGLVNVHSTDSSDNIPTVPDSGAYVMPTGNANGTGMFPTATGAPRPSGTGTPPAAKTTTASAGMRISGSVWMGVMGLAMAVWL